ncbi:Outer membrane receptor for ferrienterochelin and colicins [Bacteroides ovatus]|nr:Outer membrane receptor for ferrienterochelin and colicins [Bacteroides ovatus]
MVLVFQHNGNGFDFNVHFQGSGKSSFFINGTSVHALVTANGVIFY